MRGTAENRVGEAGIQTSAGSAVARSVAISEAVPANHPTSLSQSCKRALAHIMTRAEVFVSGRHWLIEVTLASVLFSVLFASSVDPRLWKLGENYTGAYFEKIAHPLANVGQDMPARHEAKLNFRLTVPVILHLFRVTTDQRWILPMLTAAAICGLLACSCLFTFRVTGDRVCGLFVALYVATTYIGSFGFIFCYDAIAVLQLGLAMLPRMHWVWRGALVFTASFTDERAFLASTLLLAESFVEGAASISFARQLAAPRFLAVIGAMLLYLVVRTGLAVIYGLSAPMEGVGLGLFLDNARFWHAGLWFALKGGWLVVGMAALMLWHERHRLAVAMFTLVMAGVAAGGFLVEDVGRSVSYVFPGFLVAIGVLGRIEKPAVLRPFFLLVFVISALSGDYMVWMGQISWLKPYAAQFLEFVFKMVATHVGQH